MIGAIHAFNPWHQAGLSQASVLKNPTLLRAIGLGAPNERTRSAPPQLSRALGCRELRGGRLGEAAFIRQLGLPNWFKVGKFATGIGVLIGVELIADALQGAGTRSSLREVIQSLVSPRVRLKKAVMSNDSVLRCLSAVTAAYTAIANLLGRTLDENALQAVLQSLLADPKHKPADVTFEKAKETLAALDRGRSSWVDEDGAVTEEAA